MLIEVVQSAVFGALTTGRIKPHEVIVIEGDHIGTLAGKLSDLRYLVEQELIEDEPTSDEEDEEAVEGAIEGAVEGTAETVEGETESTVSTEAVESPQEPKAEEAVKIPYEKPYSGQQDDCSGGRGQVQHPGCTKHRSGSQAVRSEVPQRAEGTVQSGRAGAVKSSGG